MVSYVHILQPEETDCEVSGKVMRGGSGIKGEVLEGKFALINSYSASCVM